MRCGIISDVHLSTLHAVNEGIQFTCSTLYLSIITLTTKQRRLFVIFWYKHCQFIDDNSEEIGSCTSDKILDMSW